MGNRIAYKRLSNIDEDADMQLEDMTFDKVFEEKIHVKSMDRPELNKMLCFIRQDEGDHVYVQEMSKLGRSIIDLYQIVDVVRKRGAFITFVKEQITFDPGNEDTSNQHALFGMMSVIADFERKLMQQRYREGVVQARASGTRFGRPPKLTEKQKSEIIKKRLEGATTSDLATEYSVSRASIYETMKNVGK